MKRQKGIGLWLLVFYSYVMIRKWEEYIFKPLRRKLWLLGRWGDKGSVWGEKGRAPRWRRRTEHCIVPVTIKMIILWDLWKRLVLACFKDHQQFKSEISDHWDLSSAMAAGSAGNGTDPEIKTVILAPPWALEVPGRSFFVGQYFLQSQYSAA